MDPNITLALALDTARRIIATSTDEDALQLADEVLALHDWLSKGGFIPAAWVTHQRQNMDRAGYAGGQ